MRLIWHFLTTVSVTIQQHWFLFVEIRDFFFFVVFSLKWGGGSHVCLSRAPRPPPRGCANSFAQGQLAPAVETRQRKVDPEIPLVNSDSCYGNPMVKLKFVGTEDLCVRSRVFSGSSFRVLCFDLILLWFDLPLLSWNHSQVLPPRRAARKRTTFPTRGDEKTHF